MVAHTIIPFVGGHLAKRFYDEPEQVQVSPLMVLVSFANILIWLIPFTWVSDFLEEDRNQNTRLIFLNAVANGKNVFLKF